MGLTAAIGELVAFWRARHPAIRFDVRLPDEESAIPDAARETLYRVVQEGLNNAVRHGRPSRIEIEIGLDPGGDLTVRVTDDGAAERRAERRPASASSACASGWPRPAGEPDHRRGAKPAAGA